MKVPQNSTVHKHPAHPWVLASCIIFGLGILAAAAFWIKKCKSTSMPRHEYSALRLENGSEKNSNDRHQQIQLQDATYTSCQQYLEYGGRYELQRRLGMMGSRPDKHWFVIKDKSLGAERLLSLVEVPQQCPLQTTATTRETMLELFRSLQHPYIHPILDVEFWDIGAAFICPLNYSGSLKDLIYGENWQEDHGRKYSGKGQGLPYRQVQCLGRQILEALLFLQNRNYPKFYHLHSGNVIIQNGVARIAAIENPLLGLPPKPPAVDECLAFGYLLFEMTTGYELPTPPSAAHLKIELERTPKIAETLWDIFESDSCPTIEELLRDDLFRGVELRELRRTTGISYVTSAEVNDLLESVKVAPLPTPITSLQVKRYKCGNDSKIVEFATVRGKTYMQIRTTTACDNQIKVKPDEYLHCN